MRAALAVALLAASALARAADDGVLRYKVPAGEENDRSWLVYAHVQPQGSNFAVKLEFSRPPWGEDCKNRCGNAVLWIDTDGDPSTGIQAPGKPMHGADLAVHVEGVRDYAGESATTYLRAKVWQLSADSARMEDGEILAELDHRRDTERLVSEGKEVFVLVDGTSTALPVGKSCKVTYVPPGDKAISARCRGLGTASGGRLPKMGLPKAASAKKSKRRK